MNQGTLVILRDKLQIPETPKKAKARVSFAKQQLILLMNKWSENQGLNLFSFVRSPRRSVCWGFSPTHSFSCRSQYHAYHLSPNSAVCLCMQRSLLLLHNLASGCSLLKIVAGWLSAQGPLSAREGDSDFRQQLNENCVF